MLEENRRLEDELRKEIIGSGDAAPIMGQSPWHTPYSLWQQKLGLLPPTEINKAMANGITLEDQALNEFMKQTDLFMAKDRVFHVNIPWMRATLDGMDVERQNIVEIKCPYTEKEHAIAEAGKIPEKYFPQVQHQLEVCGLEMAYYFSFYAKVGVIVKVYRDDKYIKDLLSKEKEFWECVQEVKAPKMIEGRDFQIHTNEIWMELAAESLENTAIIKAREKRNEEIKQALIEMAGNHNGIGGGISLTKVTKPGGIDYKAIPQLQDIDIENYRKPPSVYWRLGEK